MLKPDLFFEKREELPIRAIVAVLFMSSFTVSLPAFSDDACHAVLQARIQACAAACIKRAKAVVDTEVRGRILGYGCTNNCAKLEMFNGNTCSR